MNATLTTKAVVECPHCECDQLIDIALDSGDVFDCENCGYEMDIPPAIDFIEHLKAESL